MTELSPAARAVLEAVTWKKYDVPPEGLPAFAEEIAPLLATALRAIADQVVPAPCFASDDAIRDAILAIAAELEAQ